MARYFNHRWTRILNCKHAYAGDWQKTRKTWTGWAGDFHIFRPDPPLPCPSRITRHASGHFTRLKSFSTWGKFGNKVKIMEKAAPQRTA
jgi:hypothetical protein